jgi:integral membrane protein (TIGR01906 family)
MMINKLLSLRSYLISLLVPLALIGSALRILLTPAFLTLEYNLPYFPADEFGFTRDDRLRWAPFAVNYLVNDSEITYLADLQLGEGRPLFNDRELRHMQDVKLVVRNALHTWMTSLAGLFLLVILAYRGNWIPEYLNGLRRGGWWMIGLAAALGLIAAVGISIDPQIFWQFFTLFHEVFFEGDSWLFLYSDTLIRLFPIRFWQDALLAAALIALGGGLSLAVGLNPWSRLAGGGREPAGNQARSV